MHGVETKRLRKREALRSRSPDGLSSSWFPQGPMRHFPCRIGGLDECTQCRRAEFSGVPRPPWV